MKAVAYLKPGVGVVDVPDVKDPERDQVKIKIAYVGICGTDAHFAAGHLDRIIDKIPFPMGHEASGVITEIGPEAKVKGLKVGDKVAFYFNNYCGSCHFCRTGQEHLCNHKDVCLSYMTEYALVREQQVYKLPETISLLEGCLLEPVSFCTRNVERANIAFGKTTLISGGGAIGLLTLHLARYAGAARITVIEPVESKRQLALELGAAYAIDPIHENVQERVMEITDGIGFDCIVEASGARSTIQPMLQYSARGGTVVYTAMYGDNPLTVNLMDLFVKETTITSVYQSPYSVERANYMLPYLNLEPFTRCVFDMEQGAEAFAEQKKAIHPKVIIRFAKDL